MRMKNPGKMIRSKNATKMKAIKERKEKEGN